MLCAEHRIDTGFFPYEPKSPDAMIHNDHLATPQKMTNSNGTVVWSADYKPFGEVNITTSDITNNLRFPGQYFDAETGTLYNYFRDYNPFTGRYIQADPIGLKGGLNPYRYVQNPINFVDPLGLFGTNDFVNHYFNGSGGIDLGSVGLLGAFQNSSSVSSAVSSFQYPLYMGARSKALSLCANCATGTKTGNFSVQSNTTTDVTNVSGLFAVGGSSFFRSAQCALSTNCSAKQYSFSCSQSFSISDSFSDPLDIGHVTGHDVEVPGGTPYAITASWSQNFSGSGVW